jgi:hypothetical protein
MAVVLRVETCDFSRRRSALIGRPARRAEYRVPQRIHARAACRLGRRLDARMRCTGQAHAVLQSPVFAICIGCFLRERARQQPRVGGDLEQCDVAGVARELGTGVRKSQHEELYGELDVDHAARVVLEVEQRAAVDVPGRHSPAHVDDVRGEPLAIAWQAQHAYARGLEGRADARITGDEACARQRLVLPRPRLLALVALERAGARDEEAGRTVGPQPQVRFVQAPGARRAREPRVDSLRKTRVTLGCDVATRARRLGVMEEYDVEVRHVPELLSAELAVTDDREARRRRGSALQL